MKKNNQIPEGSEMPEKKNGTLFVVSTPIGNDEDITLRALRVLKNSDFVICEEGKVGARMLHKLNLSVKMELLNEQNEVEKSGELLAMLLDGKTLSLVSDAGTPLFADPGQNLVRAAIEKNIKVVVVPGASSIMTAIVRSNFNINQFLFAGFLNRDNKIRLQQLRNLKVENRTVVLLETPYRLMPLLRACMEIMPDRNAYLGCNLTMPFESHHYGSFSELYTKFSEMKFKGEFVLCFEGSYNTDDDIETELTGFVEDSGFEPRERRNFERNDRNRGDYRRDRKPFGDRSGSGDRRDRKPFGDRSGSGDRRDRKPFRDREESGDRRERKPFRDRKESGDRSERKPFRDRGDFSDRRERKPFRDREESGDRSERKSFRDRGDSDGRTERKSFRDRGDSDGRRERKPFRDRGDSDGRTDKKPFRDRGDADARTDRKPYRKDKDSDKKKPFGNRKGKPIKGKRNFRK